VEAAQILDPAEELFRQDISGGEFSAGVDRGYWRLLALGWPVAIIAVVAAPRNGAPAAYAFRFDLTGYPEAPTAQLWDVETNAPLPPPRWPGGGGRLAMAFNPAWRTDAIYLPVDRAALQGHDAWRAKPEVWDSGRDICQYLNLLRDLLQGESYTGARG
jgi:hypothetical protein